MNPTTRKILALALVAILIGGAGCAGWGNDGSADDDENVTNETHESETNESESNETDETNETNATAPGDTDGSDTDTDTGEPDEPEEPEPEPDDPEPEQSPEESEPEDPPEDDSPEEPPEDDDTEQPPVDDEPEQSSEDGEPEQLPEDDKPDEPEEPEQPPEDGESEDPPADDEPPEDEQPEDPPEDSDPEEPPADDEPEEPEQPPEDDDSESEQPPEDDKPDEPEESEQPPEEPEQPEQPPEEPEEPEEPPEEPPDDDDDGDDEYPTATGVVTVVDEDGEPVEGEPVTIAPPGTVEDEAKETRETDANGQVRIEFLAGDPSDVVMHTIEVRDQEKLLGIMADEHHGVQEVMFTVGTESKNSLTVNVEDAETGDAVDGEVTIRHIDTGETFSAATEDGTVTFEDIPAGTHAIEVDAGDEWHMPQDGSDEVQVDGETEHTIAMQPEPPMHELRVKVTDAETGDPVEGAEVAGIGTVQPPGFRHDVQRGNG